MKKILIIEDHEDTLELLGFLSKSVEIEVVLSPVVLSIQEIEKINPDMILLDHWIGTELGGDLCLKIKQNEALKEIPVIMISALDKIGQVAMDNFADGCIFKPFDVEEIQSVIENYIG